MAGGEGLRCRPLTSDTPKPMLPVAGRPVLEILVRQLVASGFTTIFLNVRYLREQIEAYFGDGSLFGCEIVYLREPEPYGTCGGLSLIPSGLRPSDPFLVVNADILTPLHFRAVRMFHIITQNALTLVGREYQHQIPFGVPEGFETTVTSFVEKPTVGFRVNSGIYVLNPELLDAVPQGPYDMPDLIRWTCGRMKVGLYELKVPFHEIGTPESYAKAEAFYEEHMR